jgi:hypothetical protein
LAGTETVGLTGFTGSENSVVRPTTDPNARFTTCEFQGDADGDGTDETLYGYPIGVFYMDDFVRYGHGSIVGGTDIDAATAGWQTGQIYLAADGYPVDDPQLRVVGDANPDWTASIRNNFRIGSNLRVSALIDISQGGEMWNGTAGALSYFGTHAATEQYHGAGVTRTFGTDFMTGQDFNGPGLGVPVPIDANWFTGQGNSFVGTAAQSLEDASFVKLRDISVAYTFRNQDWLSRIGFSTIDLQVVGRNLKTWTDYSGIDPESNLDGATLGRGIDYFNSPQTRSWGVNFTLTR